MNRVWYFLAISLLAGNAGLVTAADCDNRTGLTQVSEVYPTADTLPENLLRFYVYFSAPMKRENIMSSVYLTDEKGRRLNGVFLDNRIDLWSKDSKRLTVLFDPGRVKTGLVAHQTMGRALTPSLRYNLVIDGTAKDIHGCSLAKAFVKSFKVSEADYKQPDTKLWTINQPQIGSLQPLIVELNGMMDHVSLAYRLRVRNKQDQAVAGQIRLSGNEQVWQFYPTAAWSEDNYSLFVDTLIEDIVGNRISGLFDRPSLAVESQANNSRIELKLTLTPAVEP